MNKYRIGFSGASGTGKSTLMNFVADKLGLPTNPVGSRSVARDMGFDSPYDVDKAGKRGEFQSRLLLQKMLWEEEHDDFVTDRTPFDNLVYTMLHDVRTVTDEYFKETVRGVYRYTHIIYCPVSAFCDPGDDAARVKDLTYHRVYDYALWGMLDRLVYRSAPSPMLFTLQGDSLSKRKEDTLAFLENHYDVSVPSGSF